MGLVVANTRLLHTSLPFCEELGKTAAVAQSTRAGAEWRHGGKEFLHSGSLP